MLWRVKLRWYLFVFVGIPVIAVLSVVVIPGVLGSFEGLGALAPLSLLGIFVYVLFLGGALGEEPGWRGLRSPRLQSVHGPLLGTLILGALWGLWHLPLFFTPWNELTHSTSWCLSLPAPAWPSCTRGSSTTRKAACLWPS